MRQSWLPAEAQSSFHPCCIELAEGGDDCDDLHGSEHYACQISFWFPRDIPVPNNLSVNSARDTVLKLQVHFRDGVLGEHGGIGDVTYPKISR